MMTDEEARMLRALVSKLSTSLPKDNQRSVAMIFRADQARLVQKTLGLALHDSEECAACLNLGWLPHDPATCADFDKGNHCITDHPSETW